MRFALFYSKNDLDFMICFIIKILFNLSQIVNSQFLNVTILQPYFMAQENIIFLNNF